MDSDTKPDPPTTYGEPEPRDDLHPHPNPPTLPGRDSGTIRDGPTDAQRERYAERARARDGHYPGKLWRVSVFDAGGRLVFNGHATTPFIDALSNLADGLTIRYGEPDAEWGERRVLPLRPQPQPYPGTHTHSISIPPDPHTYVGDPPPYASHRHLHPHTFPDDPFRVQYHHSHLHLHPGGRPDAHGYRATHDPRDDHDAALHDHSHGDESVEPRAGYGPSAPPWR